MKRAAIITLVLMALVGMVGCANIEDAAMAETSASSTTSTPASPSTVSPTTAVDYRTMNDPVSREEWRRLAELPQDRQVECVTPSSSVPESEMTFGGWVVTVVVGDKVVIAETSEQLMCAWYRWEQINGPQPVRS
jgi:hypothetical protein